MGATKQLAEASLAAGVKCFVHASTIWVYGPRDEGWTLTPLRLMKKNKSTVAEIR
ncbi:hypothetical protein KAR34_06390 [bacterium]|nr:hypothetical protein [bacterium]